MEQVFIDIYEREQANNPPGWGSVLRNTRSYILFLEAFMKANQIKSVLDLGCGDWSFSRFVQWDKTRYLGIDIVPKIIKTNRERFTSTTVSFLHANALDIELPKADLLLCKDMLMHLPNTDIITFAQKCKNFKHCLITNNIGNVINEDKPVGDYRSIDLTAAPFHMQGVKTLTYPTDHGTKQVFYLYN